MGTGILCGIRRPAAEAGDRESLRKIKALLVASLLWTSVLWGEAVPHEEFGMQHEEMIEKQLKARGVKDPRVLEAIQSIPRHLFVPQELQDAAYDDKPLPIGFSQTISQPYIVAYMTEALQIEPKDKVLEVGTGSGYQAALLSKLAHSVYTIEIIESLQLRAKEVIGQLKISNIAFKLGNGWLGWPEKAPFDKIIVTAAANEVPAELYAQLKEGGRILFPLGEQEEVQTLVRGEKVGGVVKTKELLAVRFVPLIHDKKDF